jgi:hypothetical protein
MEMTVDLQLKSLREENRNLKYANQLLNEQIELIKTQYGIVDESEALEWPL